MKVMFSAGEASGDTHAASVANALKRNRSFGRYVWYGWHLDGTRWCSHRI